MPAEKVNPTDCQWLAVARGLLSLFEVRIARSGRTRAPRNSRRARARSFIAALAALALTVPALARAADQALEGQDAPLAQKPAPTQPPPLFPRHRRGLYKNGLGEWVLDSTPQSPPLDTDDPGVPDRGDYEINLTTDADASKVTKKLDLLDVDANYGILPNLWGHDLPSQLKLEVPISAAKNLDQPYSTGLGQAEAGLKINFYESERRGMAMSFYPQVEFAIGAGAVARGLADRGETLVLPLLLTKELKYLTLVVNAAVNTPLHDPDRHTTGTVTAAVGLPITRKLAAMAEIRVDSRFDFAHDRVLDARVGVMRAVGQAAVLYASLGRSLFSDDGLAHTLAEAGLKVLIRPNAGGTR